VDDPETYIHNTLSIYLYKGKAHVSEVGMINAKKYYHSIEDFR
jgi:hypothetical protein